MRAVLCLLLAGCSSAYNADSTYAKLKPDYPQITIASSRVPASVDVIRGPQLDLYLPAKRPAGLHRAGARWRLALR